MNDPRFGLAGVQNAEYEMQGAWCGRGYRYWPQGDLSFPGAVALIRKNPLPGNSYDLSNLARLVRDNPSASYLIGNEPNNAAPEAGDAMTPREYAEYLTQCVRIIRDNDNTARIGGPGILNWNRPDGFTSYGQSTGRAWVQELCEVYDRPLPFNFFALHSYGLRYRPSEEWAADIQDIMDCRVSLNAWGMGDIPIWITEFGATNAINENGIYDHGALAGYLDIMLPWLMSRGYYDYGVQSWFLFESKEERGMPYSFVYGLDDQISLAGVRYRDYAYLVNQERPLIVQSVEKIAPYIVRVGIQTSGGPHNTIDRIVFGKSDNCIISGITMDSYSGPGPYIANYGNLGSVKPRFTNVWFYLSKVDILAPMTQTFEIRDCVGPWHSFAGLG